MFEHAEMKATLYAATNAIHKPSCKGNLVKYFKYYLLLLLHLRRQGLEHLRQRCMCDVVMIAEVLGCGSQVVVDLC